MSAVFDSYRLCKCELSGYVHIVSKMNHCELCNWKEGSQVTITNIRKAFEDYVNQIERKEN